MAYRNHRGNVLKESRIINRNPTTASNYSFIAAIKYVDSKGNTTSCCVGSIIKKDPAVIMTAAHCINKAFDSFTEIWVELGADSISEKEQFNPEKANQFKGIELLLHPDYGTISSKYDNDIGLIFLDVNLSDPIYDTFAFKTVNIIPEDSKSVECCQIGDNLQIIGYNSETFSFDYLDLVYMDTDTCNEQLSITNNMLCAANQNNDTNICLSECDTGAPLIRTETNEQIGIFSWNYACGNNPSVYTRVGLYSDWIERNTDDNPWNDDRNNVAGIIIGSVIGGVLLMIFVMLGLCVVRMNKRDKKQKKQQYTDVETDVDTDNDQGTLLQQTN
eukprot:464674_1